MKRPYLYALALVVGLLPLLAGCSSDPNLEGARLDLRNEDYDRALENVNAALAADSANAEAYLLKGQVLEQQAFAAESLEEHSQIIDEMGDAYARAVELDPELQEDVENSLRRAFLSEFERGSQAFNRGREDEAAYGEAAAYFANAAEIQPDSSGPYINQAYSLINAGRQEEAIEPFKQAIERGEDAPESYLYLSSLYMNVADTDSLMIDGEMVPNPYGADDAVDLLEQAREKYQGSTDSAAVASIDDIQTQLLNAYVTSGQMDRAMETYQEAVETDPDNKTYRYNLGSLLLQAEDYEGAIDQLQAAIEIDPEYASAQYNLGAAYINRAVDANERVQALDDSLRANAAQLSPDETSEMETQMESLAEERRGFFEQAIPPLERAQELAQTQEGGTEREEICRALSRPTCKRGSRSRPRRSPSAPATRT